MAISQLEMEVAVLRISVKRTRKLNDIQNVKEKKSQKLKIMITSQNSTSVSARIRSEASSWENQ